MPAEALDDDHDNAPAYRGPGRRKASTGPVLDAYADGEIERSCPDCGASEYSWCRHPNGSLRRVPCGGRRSSSTDSKSLSNNDSGENNRDA